MDALRNLSSQTFIVHKGGGTIHLIPGRAVTISPEDLKSVQVQSLLRGGLATLEKVGGGAPPPGASLESAEEKKPDKKAGKSD